MTSDLEQIAKDLRARYKENLSQILFFGSRARGEATPESDYDCLLIFRQLTEDLKQDLDQLSVTQEEARRDVEAATEITQSVETYLKPLI